MAVLLMLPLYLCFRVGATIAGEAQVFPGFSQLLSLVPGQTGIYLRWAFYRLALPRCEEDACLCFATVFSHATAQIGRKAYVGVGCMLGDIIIEKDVLIGSHVSIINGNRQHGIERLDIPVREQPGVFLPVTIGADTWIGDRALVMADVGRHCVIGAGSVVTKPIPDFAIAVGNPARVIRYRDKTPDELPAERPQPNPMEPTDS